MLSEHSSNGFKLELLTIIHKTIRSNNVLSELFVGVEISVRNCSEFEPTARMPRMPQTGRRVSFECNLTKEELCKQQCLL